MESKTYHGSYGSPKIQGVILKYSYINGFLGKIDLGVSLTKKQNSTPNLKDEGLNLNPFHFGTLCSHLFKNHRVTSPVGK